MKRNEQKLWFEIYSKVTLEKFDEDSNDKSNLAEIINSINNYLFKHIFKIRWKNYIENVMWQYTDYIVTFFCKTSIRKIIVIMRRHKK